MSYQKQRQAAAFVLSRRFPFARRFALVLASAALLVCQTEAQDWPQWRGANRDAKIDDPAIKASLPEGDLPRMWTAEVGPGYSGPTVVEGRVFLTDRQGNEGETVERVLCFDALKGELLWQHRYPVLYSISYQASGPRAAVTVDDGQAFAIGGMGNLHCLEASTGKVIWQRDLNTDYNIRMPIWGITAAPLVYEDSVIQIVAGSGDACVVAFDRSTGKEKWRAVDERAGYSAPILVRQGDSDVLVCWTGESVTGLNPKTGDVFWSVEMLPQKMPIGVPTPVVEGDKLFVSSFYDGSMLVQLDLEKPAAKRLWHRVGQSERNTDALHSMISNPLIRGDAIFGVDSYGEFRCLDLATGDRIWEDDSAVPRARWATIHMIENGDQIIMLNERGDLLLASLSKNGLKIHSRSHLIDPTKQQLRQRGGVIWSHPAIANGVIYARNDQEIVAASLR